MILPKRFLPDGVRNDTRKSRAAGDIVDRSSACGHSALLPYKVITAVPPVLTGICITLAQLTVRWRFRRG